LVSRLDRLKGTGLVGWGRKKGEKRRSKKKKKREGVKRRTGRVTYLEERGGVQKNDGDD